MAADRPFPASADELNTVLARMRLGRDTAGRLRLWEQYKATVRTHWSPKSGSCFEPANRDEVLGRILQTFVTGGSRRRRRTMGLTKPCKSFSISCLDHCLGKCFTPSSRRRADADGIALKSACGRHPTTG